MTVVKLQASRKKNVNNNKNKKKVLLDVTWVFKNGLHLEIAIPHLSPLDKNQYP